jgi:methyl coenzyme M reductase subunit C-like uncharacterized protein (methanogenesis marker protein 7)
MKVIFLDIDGVLNHMRPDSYVKDREDPVHELMEEHIPLINEVIEKTGAVYIISSTWRKRFMPHPRTAIAEIFSRAGINGLVRGYTENLNDRRDTEIRKWLRDHADHYDVTAWCAIDDDIADMDRLPKQHFVKTKTSHGLLREHADELIEKLKKPWVRA